MKIVITNDDGIDAPGLRALFSCLEEHGDITTIAPEQAQSGTGHGITLGGSIVVNKTEKNRFSVRGKPADCSRIALRAIAPDADWLIAGINEGANLGSDIYNSGTVAAAREASILGYRAIAFSQYVARNQKIDWAITGHYAGSTLRMLLNKKLDRHFFWNVNLPHPLTFASKPEYRFCDPDTSPHKYDFRKEGNNYFYEGTIHERPREAGKDVAVCFGGEISISKIMI